MVRKGNLAVFEGMQAKRSKISETGEAMPTKISFYAFHVNLYLHEFFEPILFLTPPPWTIHVIKKHVLGQVLFFSSSSSSYHYMQALLLSHLHYIKVQSTNNKLTVTLTIL